MMATSIAAMLAKGPVERATAEEHMKRMLDTVTAAEHCNSGAVCTATHSSEIQVEGHPVYPPHHRA